MMDKNREGKRQKMPEPVTLQKYISTGHATPETKIRGKVGQANN